jgi:hypothetical protein
MIELDELRKEENEKFVRSIICALESNFGRLNKIRDPSTRHIVFLEKLLTIKDIFAGALENNDKKFPEDIRTRTQNLMKLMDTEIESLIDWVQQPTYSPDHPVGNAMMKEANKDFIDVYTK